MHICIDIYGHPHSLGILAYPSGCKTTYFCCADMAGNLNARTACAVDFYTGLVHVTNDGDLILPADGDIVYRPDGKIKQLDRRSVEYRPDGKIKSFGSEVFEYGQGVLPIRVDGCKKGATPPEEPKIVRLPNGLPKSVGDFIYEYTNGKLTGICFYPVNYRDDGKLQSLGHNVFRYSNNGLIIRTVP